MAIIGLLVVRRYVGHEVLRSHHDVAGYLISIVGTLYTVVLGLIVVGALNTFQCACTIVSREANSLHDIFNLAQGVPDHFKQKIRQDCLHYAMTMVKVEWKTMEKGKSSPKAHEIVQDLWTTIIGFHPKNENESNIHLTLLTKMDDLMDNRHLRLTASQPEYDWIIWGVLISGGIALVVFTYFFGVEKLSVQIMMTAFVGVALCLNLILVATFGYPYSGDVKVTSEPFTSDLNYFLSEMDKEELEAWHNNQKDLSNLSK